MKRIIFFLFLLIFLTGCEINYQNKEKNTLKKEVSGKNMIQRNVIINDKNYNFYLEKNETSLEFISLLPKKILLKELNGNEKYHYLDISLSTDSSVPSQIHKGDVMLFGDNCLVVFYKDFKTTYSYTKIGFIDNLPDFGSEDVEITFE